MHVCTCTPVFETEHIDHLYLQQISFSLTILTFGCEYIVRFTSVLYVFSVELAQKIQCLSDHDIACLYTATL